MPVDPAFSSARVSAGVSTTAVMTAVVVFLVGALATGPASKNGPAMLLLVVSGLGFLYGTLVYANSAGTMGKTDAEFNRQMDAGNVVSELLGVTPLALAVPLAVAAVTTNKALAWSSLVLSGVAFLAYQTFPYSLLRDYFGRVGAPVLAAVLVGLDVWTFVAVRSHNASTAHRLSLAGVTVGTLALFTVIGFVIVRTRPTKIEAAPKPSPGPLVAALERLQALRDAGTLSTTQFATATERVLAGGADTLVADLERLHELHKKGGLPEGLATAADKVLAENQA